MSAKFSMLLVDGHVVGRYASFLTALALLFGAYYMFNIEYPAEAAVTLEFAQRLAIVTALTICLPVCFNYIEFEVFF